MLTPTIEDCLEFATDTFHVRALRAKACDIDFERAAYNHLTDIWTAVCKDNNCEPGYGAFEGLPRTTKLSPRATGFYRAAREWLLTQIPLEQAFAA